MSRKTLYQNDAFVQVNGSVESIFVTNQDQTAIQQAEQFVNENKGKYAGEEVLIFVKHKEYKISKVENVKLEEV